VHKNTQKWVQNGDFLQFQEEGLSANSLDFAAIERLGEAWHERHRVVSVRIEDDGIRLSIPDDCGAAQSQIIAGKAAVQTLRRRG